MAEGYAERQRGGIRGTNPVIRRQDVDEGTPLVGIQRFDTAPEELDYSYTERIGDGLAQSPPRSPEAGRRTIGRGSVSTFSTTSKQSIPPPGSVLTGKQEHYLKRELLSEQTEWEISELSSPTALQRFGAPFKSDAGEVAPEDSELPLLRYIFVHFVRNFPFLDQAKEREFWQDKLQVVSRLD